MNYIKTDFAQSLLPRIIKELDVINVEEVNLADLPLNGISADAEKSLTQSGHTLAMSSAASQISNRAATNELMSGLTYVNRLKSLKESISNDKNLNKYIDSLVGIQNKIATSPMYSFTASSLDQKELNLGIPAFMSDITFGDQALAPKQERELGWITGSQVCFCATKKNCYYW